MNVQLRPEPGEERRVPLEVPIDGVHATLLRRRNLGEKRDEGALGHATEVIPECGDLGARRDEKLQQMARARHASDTRELREHVTSLAIALIVVAIALIVARNIIARRNGRRRPRVRTSRRRRTRGSWRSRRPRSISCRRRR